ncbi:tyrosine-protein phosphatase [Myroides injenensis]|uniref:tyrosine-protein phosphatase n=1 Tax=Myroides injenensis TaxID=1183151 RepID=UPI00030AA6DD|nr:CpsB/CapC family capsule biosynthesis tyrosine phosphatase [Myroides injenensis]
MFSMFKSKPALKEIIPSDYIDIHSHLMFGIDDGAQTPDDTKFIIESMKSLGFDQAITTPHTTPLVWDNTKEGILSKYDEVKNILSDHADMLSLRVASEYMMDDSFLKRMEQEELLTLKDKYVLVEMSYINPPIQLFDILFQLKSRGYEIVLAHPERYNFYHQNTDMYLKLKKMGCNFQMNLLSVTGYYGGHVLEAAKFLLKNDLIDFAGSDIHHSKHIKGFESKVQVKDIKNLEKAISNNKIFKI